MHALPAVGINGPSHPHVVLLITCQRKCAPFTLIINNNPITSLCSSSPSVPSALADTDMTSRIVLQPTLGTTSTKPSRNRLALASSPNMGNNSVANGKKPMDGLIPTSHYISALVVAPNPMEPSIALVLRTHFPSTPYKVDEWDCALHAAIFFLLCGYLYWLS